MYLQSALRNRITIFEILASGYIVVATWLMFLVVSVFTVVLLFRYLLPAAVMVAAGILVLYVLRNRYPLPSLPIARWWWWTLVLLIVVLAPAYSYFSGVLTIEHIRKQLDIDADRVEFSAMLLDDVINNGTTSDGGTRYVWGLYKIKESELSAVEKLKETFRDQEYWVSSSSEKYLLSANCDYSERYVEPPGIFIDLDHEGRLGISRAAPAPF